MASPASRGGHLPATGERDVVFCHACENEWYRDERRSLECPRCDSAFTEIVDPANDPRAVQGTETPSSTGSGLHFRRPGGSDSDPDEDDIEEHSHGMPRGFMRGSLFDPPFATLGSRDRPNMNEGDAILRRFADMLLNDLGGGRVIRGAPGPGAFSEEEHMHLPGTTIHQRTFRTGPFGGTHTRVTITSGTMRDVPERPPPINFGTLFGQLMGPALMPGAHDEPGRRDRAGAEPVYGFAPGGGIHELLSSLWNPAEAVHGDAVFTQEALDRIITQLMDASPQTNAAPPASQAAIDRLEKKRVDDTMLGEEGKAECTICMDEMKKGDEVLILPCKHWYHGECVVLWLKEHNTCPICRMPIESREEGGNNNNNNNNNNNGGGGNNSNRRHSHQHQQYQTPSPSNSASASTSTSASNFSPFSSFTPRSSRTRPERPTRSVRENLERLNSIRNVAGADLRRSDMQSGSSRRRRNSLSPPGAWPMSDDEDGPPRSRARSPSASRDRDRDRDRGGGSASYMDWEYTSPDYPGGRRGNYGSIKGQHGSALVQVTLYPPPETQSLIPEVTIPLEIGSSGSRCSPENITIGGNPLSSSDGSPLPLKQDGGVHARWWFTCDRTQPDRQGERSLRIQVFEVGGVAVHGMGCTIRFRQDGSVRITAVEGRARVGPVYGATVAGDDLRRSDLIETELAALQSLRRQLAELEKEVYDRERRLAEMMRLDSVAALDDDDDDDCAGLRCVVRVILRKAEYAAAAIFSSDGAEQRDYHPDHGNCTPINHNTLESPPPHGPHDDSTKPEIPTDSKSDGPGNAITRPPCVKVVILFLVLAPLFRTVALWRERRSRRREEHRRRWLGWLWERVWGVGNLPGGRVQGRRQGEIRAGGGDGYDGCWDKKAAMDMGEKKDYAPLGCRTETDTDEESESEGERELAEARSSTLEDEFASFRAAVGLVEDMVAAEEGRAVGRRT
ncbi:hypothetical protein VTK56DRAFT_6342 [Thermocarpiscus australiensis]